MPAAESIDIMGSTVKVQYLGDALGTVRLPELQHRRVLEPLECPGLPVRLRSMVLPNGTFPKPWQSRALYLAFHAPPARLQ